MSNVVILTGRNVRDPELRYLPNGTAMTKFVIAVDRNLSKDKKQEAEKNNQPTADFISCIAWGKTAEAVANYTEKGKLILVNGRLQTNSYDDKDGKKIYTFDIVANQVEFLEWKSKDNTPTEYGQIEGFHPTDNDDIQF